VPIRRAAGADIIAEARLEPSHRPGWLTVSLGAPGSGSIEHRSPPLLEIGAGEDGTWSFEASRWLHSTGITLELVDAEENPAFRLICTTPRDARLALAQGATSPWIGPGDRLFAIDPATLGTSHPTTIESSASHHPYLMRALEAVEHLGSSLPAVLSCDTFTLRLSGTESKGTEWHLGGTSQDAHALVDLHDDNVLFLEFILRLEQGREPLPILPKPRAIDLAQFGFSWSVLNASSADEAAKALRSDGFPSGRVTLAQGGSFAQRPELQFARLAFSSYDSRPAGIHRGLRHDPAESLQLLALSALAPEGNFTIENANEPMKWLAGADAVTTAAWKRAAKLRLAFMPYLLHGVATEARTGQPWWHPMQMDGEVEEPWQPHVMVGPDVLLAGMAPLSESLVLPPGEWIDYDEGGRFSKRRTLFVPQGQSLPAGPPSATPTIGRLAMMLRVGAIVPMFDLTVVSPIPGVNDPDGTGPPRDRLLLKIVPHGHRSVSFFDPLAVVGQLTKGADLGWDHDAWRHVSTDSGPMLDVRVDREARHTEIEIVTRGTTSRQFILMLRMSQPARVLAGHDARAMAELAHVEKDAQWSQASECWMYHPFRDEVLIRVQAEPNRPLLLRLDDIE